MLFLTCAKRFQAVITSHVNICDLLAAPFLGQAPTRFTTEVALSEYTRRTERYFPKEDVAKQSLLGYLLRHILNPRLERGVARAGKSRAS